jgi:hypothetical protein
MKTKGQALVEMAIVILLLFLLVFGIFQFGWLMYIKNTLNNAARAGARQAVVLPLYDSTTYPKGLKDVIGTPQGLNDSCSFTGENSTVYSTTCNSLYYGIDKDHASVEVTYNDLDSSGGITSGDLILVKVTLAGIKGFVPDLISIKNSLSGEASMRYE